MDLSEEVVPTIRWVYSAGTLPLLRAAGTQLTPHIAAQSTASSVSQPQNWCTQHSPYLWCAGSGRGRRAWDGEAAVRVES